MSVLLMSAFGSGIIDNMRHSQIDPTEAALTRLEKADAQRRQADVDKVRALLDLADTWDIDQPAAEFVVVSQDLPKHHRALERRLVGGADGTPQIGEFLALEIGPALGVTPKAAAGLLADALNLRDRHPTLWTAVQAGHLEVWQARRVTQATINLASPAAQWVDQQLAITARLVPWPRAIKQVAGLVVKAAPALAAERATKAAARRYIQFGEVTDSHVDIWGRLDFGDAIALKTLLNYTAEGLIAARREACAVDPEMEPLFMDEARAIALGVLARGDAALATDPQLEANVDCVDRQVGSLGTEYAKPNQADRASRTGDGRTVTTGTRVRPNVALVVHVSDVSLARGDGVARVEGWGPELIERLPRLLAGSKVTVRPVLDPATVAAADSYEIPERLRWAVCTRNPVDTFPYGSRPARSCDLDHTIPYPDGPTSIDNLAPLSRRPHRAKTHGLWTVTQIEPGHYEWTSRLGRRYAVTPSGTQKLASRPAPGSRRADRPHTPTTIYKVDDRHRVIDYMTPPLGATIDITDLIRRRA